jgi:hypothetical protein
MNEKVSKLSSLVSMKDVRRYYRLPWDRNNLSCNPNIEIDVVKMDLPNAVGEWNWLSICIYVRSEDVINNPNERWDKSMLSWNENICMEVINMDLPNATGDWKWSPISSNIRMNDIILYPDYPWNRQRLSINQHIDIERIFQVPSDTFVSKWCKWNLSELIHDGYLDVSIVDREIDSSSNYNWSSISNGVSIESVIRYPHYPWDRKNLSMNEKLDIDILDLELPNSVDEFDIPKILARTHIHKWKDILRHELDIGMCKGISVDWMDVIWRMTNRPTSLISKFPNWECDICITFN